MSNVISAIDVTVEQIISGKDDGMPTVELGWGESVTFRVHPLAQLLFKFRGVNDGVLTLVSTAVGGASVLKDVDLALSSDGKLLTVTIKPGTGPWTAKGTLFFLGLLDKIPNAKGVDPLLKNKGA